MRDKKGRFVKGHKTIPGSEKGWFKKGHQSDTQFKKGCKAWNSGKKVPQISGSKHPNWVGGKHTDHYGYVWVYAPEHPNSRRNYIREHRLVMEGHIGRYLKPEEVVHHINRKRNDNRIENLELHDNHSSHVKTYHTKAMNIANNS